MKDECLNFCDNILKQHYYGDENSYKTGESYYIKLTDNEKAFSRGAVR